jgi:preprotein translocase subunit SecF
MLSGTYSSICIATPVLADLKERDPQYKLLAKQVAQRAAGGRAAIRKARQAAVAGATAAGNGNGNGGATAVTLAGSDPDVGEPQDDGAETLDPGEVKIPGQGASSVREVGQRQQPSRRPGATNRRPSGKKKRR